ncbi:MAG: adenylyltransferase/cytidyltransferase family protein [Bacteroidota bacterium]
MTKYERIIHKIMSQEEASTLVNSWKSNDEAVVFTNGCFDLLHRGHVTYLGKAAERGHYLVVGINSDESVKRQQKGPERPINDEMSRALVVASLEFVDLVVIFDDDTPESLIELLTPTTLIKGADYDANETDASAPNYIVGSKTVKEAGGRVDTIPLEEGYSTTGIINKIKGS